MKEYNKKCDEQIKDQADLTTLSFHTEHVESMFRLMKNYKDEISDILNDETDNDSQTADDIESDQKNESISSLLNNVFTVTYKFKRYPSTNLFETTDVCVDQECKLLNNEIKQSNFWKILMNSLQFTNNKKTILRNVSHLSVHKGSFDNNLQRVCIALLVSNQWHPGIIVAVHGVWMQIFLPYHT